ncbi:MAG: hypothetical protein GY807_02155 [Gammaproteobacteria bacterium]|nr:hypothetical protein [Gammaproteobacteria bacterium]
MKYLAQSFVKSSKARWTMVASGFLFILLSGVVSTEAQDCSISSLMEATNTTKAAQANFTCMQSRLLSAISRIETLEAEMEPYRVARGIIAAFDRSEEDACPRGWTRFSPAGGRVIVGAGVNKNVDANGVELTDYPSLNDDPIKAVGGLETVTLTSEQMPSHNHNSRNDDRLVIVNKFDTNSGPLTGDPSQRKPNLSDSSGLSSAGGADGVTQEHENMPPYVALYFCKKD